jgi:hypothetical protein
MLGLLVDPSFFFLLWRIFDDLHEGFIDDGAPSGFVPDGAGSRA